MAKAGERRPAMLVLAVASAGIRRESTPRRMRPGINLAEDRPDG
jgi:hypothetical protein